MYLYNYSIARNAALTSRHAVNAVLSKIYQFSVELYLCKEKLTVDNFFWSYTQLQTAPVLKRFEDRGRAHAHHAKICT